MSAHVCFKASRAVSSSLGPSASSMKVACPQLILLAETGLHTNNCVAKQLTTSEGCKCFLITRHPYAEREWSDGRHVARQIKISSLLSASRQRGTFEVPRFVSVSHYFGFTGQQPNRAEAVSTVLGQDPQAPVISDRDVLDRYRVTTCRLFEATLRDASLVVHTAAVRFQQTYDPLLKQNSLHAE